jgi:3-dehydroquinate dehydratase type I
VTSRICVSILPKNNVDALSLIEQAEKAKADFIEVRLDCFEVSRNLSELSKSTKIPLIAANKLQSEKGYFSGTGAERQQTLLNAAKSGFKYVDVDLANPKHKETVNKLKELGTKPIVSFHKFDGVLSSSEMGIILKRQISIGAAVCKIVTTANKIEDNLTVLNFISAMPSRVKLVCFCMGEKGKVSRILSPMFGAFFTFASLNQGSETASGQISIHDMRVAYELLGAK